METLLREAKEKNPEIPASLKEQIVLEHTPLIRYIVNRIAVRLPSHIDLDDLHNTGVIGLMDAIEKYDPEKNCKFKTYAEFRIKGAILDQLRSLDWVPRSVRQKSRRLERAYGEVEQRLGRSASEDEVADSLGLQIDKFHELLNQVRGISLVNLEEIRGTNSDGDRAGSFADIVEDVHSENPFASLKLTEMKQVIATTIATLPEKERLVISLYYYEDLNMKEIGGILGHHRIPRLPDPHEVGPAPAREAQEPARRWTGRGRRSGLFLLDARHHDGDVVLAAPRVGEVHELIADRLDVGLVGDDVRDLLVAHVAGQAVRAQHEDVERRGRQLGQIGLDAAAHAERAGQHVPVGMAAGGVLGDLPAPHQLRHQRVVVGQLPDLPAADQVGAAVADVGQGDPPARPRAARPGWCPCPASSGLAFAVDEDLPIRGRQRVAELVREAGRGPFQGPHRADRGLGRQLARDLSRRVPAHAVRHQVETQLGDEREACPRSRDGVNLRPCAQHLAGSSAAPRAERGSGHRSARSAPPAPHRRLRRPA